MMVISSEQYRKILKRKREFNLRKNLNERTQRTKKVGSSLS